MDAPNTAIIRRFQQALESHLQGHAADLGAFFTPDAIWHLPRSAEAWGGRDRTGRDAILCMMKNEVPQFYRAETMRFLYHHFTEQGDRVHMHFTLHAITANGKDYSNEYQTLFRLHDGRIAEAWEYLDTAYLFSLLGSA